jgi:hypothetical protein
MNNNLFNEMISVLLRLKSIVQGKKRKCVCRVWLLSPSQ